MLREAGYCGDAGVIGRHLLRAQRLGACLKSVSRGLGSQQRGWRHSTANSSPLNSEHQPMFSEVPAPQQGVSFLLGWPLRGDAL